jgi:hypothetical protein
MEFLFVTATEQAEYNFGTNKIVGIKVETPNGYIYSLSAMDYLSGVMGKNPAVVNKEDLTFPKIEEDEKDITL